MEAAAAEEAAEAATSNPVVGGEQSGQIQSATEARVSGGLERHCTCQGVIHVRQRTFSASGGVALHFMQAPSPATGRSEDIVEATAATAGRVLGGRERERGGGGGVLKREEERFEFVLPYFMVERDLLLKRK